MNSNNEPNKLIKELKQTNSQAKLQGIKSKYILKKILGNIKIFKSLEIIRYNKVIQEKLSLGLNNYKDYFELYTPIIYQKKKKIIFIYILMMEKMKLKNII